MSDYWCEGDLSPRTANRVEKAISAIVRVAEDPGTNSQYCAFDDQLPHSTKHRGDQNQSALHAVTVEAEGGGRARGRGSRRRPEGTARHNQFALK